MGGGRLRRSLTWAVACLAALTVAACSGDDAASDVGSDAQRSSTSASSAGTSASTTSPPTSGAPSTTATTAPPPTSAAAVVPVTYVFPVRPAAAASYARSHHDYPAADIFAACGSDVVAIADGTVQDVSREDTWSSKVDSGESRGGLSVSVVGNDGVRSYGSHLREVDPAVQPGTPVTAGQRLGAVGDTGNAAGAGCHLHFGLSAPCGPGDWQRRRGEVWPQQYLDSWRSGGGSSPVAEIGQRRC